MSNFYLIKKSVKVFFNVKSSLFLKLKNWLNKSDKTFYFSK